MTAAPPGRTDPRPETDRPPGPPTAAATAPGVEVPEVRRVVRQRVARRKAARRRAVYLQVGFTVLALVALVALALFGWRSAMRITGGSDEIVTDPDQPGFVAEVRPTPVTLAAITGDGGELISMLLLVTGQGGITAAPISPLLTLWDFEGSPPESAQAIYADGGVDSLRLRLGAELGFGATDAVVVPGSSLVSLADGEPLTFTIADDVFGGDPQADPSQVEMRWPAGEVQLDADLVDDFLAFVGYREPDTNRSLRSAALWRALLERLDRAPSGEELGGGEDVERFSELLDELLSAEEVSYQVLPMTPVELYTVPPISIHRLDQGSMPEWAASHVPFPVSAFPGQLPTVAVLDGTGQEGAIRSVTPRVVAAGAEVALTGNAESFDVETSRVEYRRAEVQTAAQEIAMALGLSATHVEDQRDDVDVTVVVGKDLLG